MPRQYPVFSIGDVYDFGSLVGTTSDVAVYRVVTARDPLRIHTTPGANTPAIGLVAPGTLVQASGKIESAGGLDYAEVQHPTLGAYGWADLRYLASATDANAIAEKQAINNAAQAVLDAGKAASPSAPSTSSSSAPTPSPLPAPQPQPSGISRTQFQASASLGGWTIVGVVAIAAAVYYVSRKRST